MKSHILILKIPSSILLQKSLSFVFSNCSHLCISIIKKFLITLAELKFKKQPT